MKPLDKNKKYDLSQLNDEQLQTVLDWLKENDTWKEKHIKHFFENNFSVLVYDIDVKEWFMSKEKIYSVNAIELFEFDLKEYQVIEYESIESDALGVKKEIILAINKKDAWIKYKELKGLDDSHKKLFLFRDIITQRIIDDGFYLRNIETEMIYERADKLMQEGKQHGLKIVVTFEKL